jgi:UDP-galactopyranose mutase
MALKSDLVRLANSSDVIVVGAGLFGLTVAERIASQLSKKVTVIEKREVIGGNAFSYFDDKSGIEIHKYGSHLFHTSNERVWEYVNQFTRFTDYKHKVFTKYNGVIYSMPISLHTLSQFFGKDMNPQEARILLSKDAAIDSKDFENFEDKAIAAVGREIYEAFFKNYTLKQWQVEPKKLPADIFTRLPIRYNLNNDYFNDKYQGLPVDGYQKWFSNMVQNPNINLLMNADYFQIKEELDLAKKVVIYTGPIDRYFDYRHGELSWRTLDFEFESIELEDFQGTSVMNYADAPPFFTRIHEFKHLHPERRYSLNQTVIAREFSRKATKLDEPYYPINSKEDREMLLLYRADMAKEGAVFFGGRLGTYQYLDMHMAIASALTLFENELVPLLEGD